MGIIWRFAMPLLSTLAALVIIVHSVEEDRESDYRRELRPRILDTGTPNYDRDEPWRVIDAEPGIQKSSQTDIWPINSEEELPKRRKAGRKRKRRPQISSTGELALPQNYPEEPLQPYLEDDSSNTQQITEIPRRRKKLASRPDVWTGDPLDPEIRLQRRRQRKKRPSLEYWPQLSEFSEHTREKSSFKVISEPTEQIKVDDNTHDSKNIQEHFVQKYLENYDELENPGHKTDIKSKLTPQDKEEQNEFYRRPHLLEDKNLSEFSYEVMTRVQEPKEDLETKQVHEKIIDKSYGALSAYHKAQDKGTFHGFRDKDTSDNLSRLQPNKISSKTNYQSLKHSFSKKIKANEKMSKSSKLNILAYDTEAKVDEENTLNLEELDFLGDDIYIMDNSFIDPVTLKDILKRSNGTSLSEILQHHNLSLSDLLHGKGNAISILKSEDSIENNSGFNKGNTLIESKPDIAIMKDTSEIASEEKLLLNLETKYVTDPINEYATTTQSTHITQEVENNKHGNVYTSTTVKPEENIHKILARRRFPPGIRRKLRMTPTMNTTYKSQLRRDSIALNAEKYLQHRRNVTKSKEWKHFTPPIFSVNTTENCQKNQDIETTTMTSTEEETITKYTGDKSFTATEKINNSNEVELNNTNAEITIASTKTTNTDLAIENFVNVTDEPMITQTIKHPVRILGLYNQAFNNKSKKKRVRQKNSTIEPPKDDNIEHNIFEIPDLVSSSKSISTIQGPETISPEDEELFTELEDFITTQNPKKRESRTKANRNKSSSKLKTPIIQTTEKTAKFEIEEILNDTQTSERLSRILIERNMTLSELVEHRERGSSHVHLADIFHNASKEPNPSEPFLSKSFIEPISKETYPLRAILEANLHEATVKPTTIVPNVMDTNYVSIPVVMDFGNNVNENAENMGIMSLFNNLTKSDIARKDNRIMKDSEGRLYKADIIAMNTTQFNNTRETDRENKMLSDISKDDVVSWNEIFALMRKNYKNETRDILQSFQEELSPSEAIKKITLEEDIDGDGLIVLEDLQHLKDFDSNIASDEKLEVDSLEKSEEPAPGILHKIPSQTKSVTVATASIAGLAMILFLLTYAAFKWKQQRVVNSKKHSLCHERIPTPVFENRKGNKNSCSTRSMSPMLATSNIYTLNTLDSRNGKESPDYMWDTLRKPFQ